jgi:hypothetical protein
MLSQQHACLKVMKFKHSKALAWNAFLLFAAAKKAWLA